MELIKYISRFKEQHSLNDEDYKTFGAELTKIVLDFEKMFEIIEFVKFELPIKTLIRINDNRFFIFNITIGINSYNIKENYVKELTMEEYALEVIKRKQEV